MTTYHHWPTVEYNMIWLWIQNENVFSGPTTFHQSLESKIEETRLKNCIYIQQFKPGKLRLLGDEQYKTKQDKTRG